MHMLFVYHRGGGKSLGYPPNCLLTIKWAVKYGAKAIEYDVVFCNDKTEDKIIIVEPKLLKENNLDINNLHWEDVSKIDAGNEKYGTAQVATIDEALGVINDKNVSQQIHIKGDKIGTVQKTIKTLLPKLKNISNFVLTTFDLEVVKQIRANDKNVKVGWIVKPDQKVGNEGMIDMTAQVAQNPDALPPYSENELMDISKKAKENFVNVIILCGSRVKEEKTVLFFRNQGFEVGAWGVASNLEVARRLIEFKIDRFTIDNPEEL